MFSVKNFGLHQMKLLKVKEAQVFLTCLNTMRGLGDWKQFYHTQVSRHPSSGGGMGCELPVSVEGLGKHFHFIMKLLLIMWVLF